MKIGNLLKNDKFMSAMGMKKRVDNSNKKHYWVWNPNKKENYKKALDVALKGVNKMLNDAYMLKWKKDMEIEIQKNTKEVTEEVTLREAINTIKLLKSEGASDKLIMSVAKKKNIPDKIVKEILYSYNTKKVTQV